jgi:hypothetical protein
MELEIGDVLVFTGGKNMDEHFNKFEKNKTYTISSIGLLYDHSEYTSDSRYVTFHESDYGSLFSGVRKYFVHQDDFRDEKLNEIL